MESTISPKKIVKSPVPETIINSKTSVTCTAVPEGLFDANTAKKHFSKFGRVQRIRLFPKRQMCIVEYEQPTSAERAVLNAGAFDGFMFDVTRYKARVRKRSKKEEDPDWIPDSDVEEELSAMGGASSYRITRQNPKKESSIRKPQEILRTLKPSPPMIKKKIAVAYHPSITLPKSGIESPVQVPSVQTSLSTTEAAAELHQLQFRVSLTPDEQWRTLEARDKILRNWGGAGSRVKVGGATIGTCQDMCPEKELLHRQAEHQVMTLETVLDSDGQLEPWRAVKQYSRSSADQEIPMCYELRPASALMRTCAYLLHEIADTKRPVVLADWFHFMWDRLRSIRKDITQQALCCSDSIYLVEMCARFHAHCAARLADLEHTQFDQKLNTDNLTKCLQTLKHMYADVSPKDKPKEAEFRGYIALLNLGDANFWWEIKQLPSEIQKSEPLIFATQVFNAIDNNNYVKFFRLVKQKATYLQACILLRYFNDVRARALARIVKAYAPRGGSRFPVSEIMESLAFESLENMKCFINHYGLRFAKTDSTELTIILDRNHFIEDSDPYPISRAVSLIESKRKQTVGEVIAGGLLPNLDFKNHVLRSSFTNDGKLKDSALLAEDQGYNTKNDSNKDIQVLKEEMHRIAKGEKFQNVENKAEQKMNLFQKTEPKMMKTFGVPSVATNQFSFKAAIPVASKDIIKNSPEKIFEKDAKNAFSFSKPQESSISHRFKFETKSAKQNIFTNNDDNQDSRNGELLVKHNEDTNLFKQNITEKNNKFKGFGASIFKQPDTNIIKQQKPNKPDFANVFNQKEAVKSIFGQQDSQTKIGNIFAKSEDKSMNIFSKTDSTVKFANNIFSKPIPLEGETKPGNNIFGTFNKTNKLPAIEKNIFSKPFNTDDSGKLLFVANGDVDHSKLSPGSLFKSAINSENSNEPKSFSIFKSKNKGPSVAENIFKSATKSTPIYEFQNEDEAAKQEKIKEEEIKLKEKLRQEEHDRKERLRQEEIQRRLQEEKRIEEERRREEARLQEARKKQEEARKKQEELRQREEEKRQEELKRKLAEEKERAELKRKEEERLFKERVDKESLEVVDELLLELCNENVSILLKEEDEIFKNMILYAANVTDEVLLDLTSSICSSEMKAEKFRIDKIRKKWFSIWRHQLLKNVKRRNLLEDTPVWLTSNTPLEEATYLRRLVEKSALTKMNAFHRGHRFSGELKQPPSIEPYNLMEIIKSPLLKRMKQINYPYDKCFFLESYFSVIKFEALEGTNGLLVYFTDYNQDLSSIIETAMKNKYPYQAIPVVVILPKYENFEKHYNTLVSLLTHFQNNNSILGYKIIVIEPRNIYESLNIATKTALKWLAKKYPESPPLEIDLLKSICQRYLGNEIWCYFKTNQDGRMGTLLKDLPTLVECYNKAVEKLTEVITKEDLFNYPLFPLEFNIYLDQASPYPKPYEFIPSNVKTSDNISAIKDIMNQLKLPNPLPDIQSLNETDLQQEIRQYCNQLGWLEKPEEVICRVVALLPNQFSDIVIPADPFSDYFAHYDLIDILNIIVYEKINRLSNFGNRYAIYERTAMKEFQIINWFYESDVMAKIKHKVREHEDDIDFFIKAKRRKIAFDSMDYSIIRNSDVTLVQENITATDENISRYNSCSEAVKQLEQQIESEKQKSIELENLLKRALSNV
ncbi:hypothetical protein ACJJTC_015358 [Scirpophaga incertulas]